VSDRSERTISTAPARSADRAQESGEPTVTARVLVARLDGAGDVLLAGPAVRAVAASGTQVTLLCGPAGAAAARLLPGVSDVVVWASPWVVNPAPPIDRAALDRFVDDLAARAFDEAVILTSFHQSPLPTALLLRLAGVGRITGASIDYPGTLLDVRLRPGEDLPEDLPEPERALAIAAAAGYRLPADDPGDLAVLPPPPVDDLLADVSGAYVVLHPGAAVGARRWPAGHHRRAAGLLADDGLTVVVTGGPDERALTAEVAAGAHGRAVDLGGRTGLRELSGVLAGAAAVVVGNTGAAHLAAAVGTPVVSLFAPVVPAVRWRPYRVPQVLLGDQTAPCRDTRARDCPVPGHPCLSDVTPEEVRDAVRRLRDPAPPPPLGPPLLVLTPTEGTQ
jgi:ADP-heptose:LPS heptosyltransferase